MIDQEFKLKTTPNFTALGVATGCNTLQHHVSLHKKQTQFLTAVAHSSAATVQL